METKSRGFIRGYITGVATVFGILLLSILGFRLAMKDGLTLRENVNALWKLNTLASYLNEKCLEDTDNASLLDGAYAGLVDTVDDKYTRYYTAEEYREYMEDLVGSYAGIGVSVQWDATEEMLHIVSVNEGGPGEKAGICVGDWVYAVDGTTVQGMSSDDTIRLIKGEVNTKVIVTVIRDGSTLDIELIREQIDVETVNYQMLDHNIGYICLSAFDEVTTEQFLNAVEDLKAQGMQGMILDLRDNLGGRLQTAIDICDALLPEGTITYTEDKQGKQKYYTSDAECLETPLVLLVNENSASASEIVAGAIQDSDRGTIIGTTTYGKGIVQSTYGLPDGSAIKLTMAKYFTPSGRYIHGEGIEPDIEIALSQGTYLEDVKLTEEDVQLQTAVEAIMTIIDHE